MQINYIEKTPIAAEFNMLTESVGWGTRENNIIEEALKNVDTKNLQLEEIIKQGLKNLARN